MSERHEQALEGVLTVCITAAGLLLKSGTIDHRYKPPGVTNHAHMLKVQRALCDPAAPDRQQCGDLFVRHRQIIAFGSVQAEQQPATQLLPQRMPPGANCSLRNLHQHSLGEPEQHCQDGRLPMTFILQEFRIESEAPPRA